jgi:SNF2 family DNA or RNA helicase
MVTASLSMRQRVAETESWAEAGGILILSYDLFRRWMQLDEKQSTQNSLDHKTLEKLQGHLLNVPSIVVADEAHKMKNTASKLALAAAEFKSKSRIALTGSPLANNLRDYFAMVNWIASGYLGNEVAFRANYIEPIEEGLYVESTHYERRRSLKKLQVLKEILDPKINRADISVLKGSLPPKVEFVITVPLTELQKTAYNNYVRLLLTEKSADVHMATLWAWLGTLGLCCNHPSCFYEKLLNQTKKARQLSEVADEEKQSLIEKSLNDESNELDDDKLLEDTPISSPGLNEVMYNSQEQAFLNVSDLEDPKHSYRSEIFLRIVEESVKAGDKVLCFSHSIPTLNYLEVLLKQCGKQYCRLDGSTPVSSRQKATKEFNRHASLEVYLISTRAGGLGLNIFGANRVIIFDFGFNPTWEEQAVARAYRLGQTKPVFVYRFLAGGTFEEIIHNKSVFKSQLAMRVVDKKNVVRWASKSLGDYLFPVKEVKAEDISGFMGKDVHVLDKIIQDDRGSIIRKIALTETFSMEDHDRLTEEERKDVEQELDLERLKRSDPVAYDQRLRAMQLSATTTISTAMPAAMPIRMAFPTNQSYHMNQQPH